MVLVSIILAIIFAVLAAASLLLPRTTFQSLMKRISKGSAKYEAVRFKIFCAVVCIAFAAIELTAALKSRSTGILVGCIIAAVVICLLAIVLLDKVCCVKKKPKRPVRPSGRKPEGSSKEKKASVKNADDSENIIEDSAKKAEEKAVDKVEAKVNEKINAQAPVASGEITGVSDDVLDIFIGDDDDELLD